MTVKPVPFFSGALNRRMTCFIHLPPGYEETTRTYPVIYLLHGMHGSESDWTEKGNAHLTAHRMYDAGQLRESILVMPNDGGYGSGTFYMNWYDGSGNFEDYLTDDVIPYIDAHFRTSRDPRERAIAGLSMGGFGAFYLALRHQDLFGTAASLSGALGTLSLMSYKDYARSEFPRMAGPLQGAYAKETDLYEIITKRASQGEANRTRLYFNCGEKDVLYPLNKACQAHLDAVGYPYSFEAYPGEHTWEYWTEHLADALRFIESTFPPEA